MGIMLRNNKDIKGIKISNHEYKVLQYADDTALLLDGSENSLKNALSLIGQFSKYSGLKPNFNKTVCIKIGTLRYSDLRFCEDYNLTWSQAPFKFLGITFSTQLSEMEELNFSSKIQELRKLINSWSRRILSTNGRITVVKTILLPKLTHLLIALPNPSDIIVKELERMFFRYIWNNKMDRISRKNLVQDYKDGGLRMICLKSFIKSLKITWIRRIVVDENDAAWRRLLNDITPSTNISFLNYGPEYLIHLSKLISNNFWKDVFRSYYHLRCLLDKDQVIFEPIWYNKMIKVGGNVQYLKEWVVKGILFVYDLLDQDGKLLSYEAFCDKYNFAPPFTKYYGIMLNIQKLNYSFDIELFTKSQPHFPNHVKILYKNKKGSRDFYDTFIKSMYCIPKSQPKWENELELSVNGTWWREANQRVHKETNDSTLKWLQYRIIHRILGTNILLHKVGISSTNLCTFCNSSAETISHLFFICQYSYQLWFHLENWLRDTLNIEICLRITEIIFGVSDKKKKVLNIIICLIKQYIFRQKMSKSLPTFWGAKQHIIKYIKTEKFISKKNMKAEQFSKKWGIFEILTWD